MRKKLINVLLLSLVASTGLVSCSSETSKNIPYNKEEETEEHVHTYYDYWVYNDTYHYRIYTCGHGTGEYEEHIFELDNVIPATYISEGVFIYKCSVCKFEKRVTIDKLTHNYSSNWTSDRIAHWHQCTDQGFTELKKDYENHIFVTTTIDPTYEKEGKIVHSCSICNYSYYESIPQLKHNHADYYVYDSNEHWYPCTDSGYSTFKVENEPHTYNVTTIEPTFDQSGLNTYICVKCGYSYQEIINKLPHNYSKSWVGDESGHWHPCSDAGYEHLITGFSSHNFIAKITAPTYEENGYTTYTCTVCGFHYNANEIEKLEHHYSSEYVNDTIGHWHACTDEGYDNLKSDYEVHYYVSSISGEYIIYTCSICGFTYLIHR